MGDKTAIGWTDATWNPVTGCSKVSPGCAHCYAESLTRRFAWTWGVPDLPWTPENAAENVILHPERLDQPLRWKRPRLVFVNSMSDLFHEEIADDYIAKVFARMNAARQHIFQVLTKRPERMRDLLSSDEFWTAVGDESSQFWQGESLIVGEPLPNVWLGTSIENRRYVHRADLLRETPAAVRFISAEPLLGPLAARLIDFSSHRHAHRYHCAIAACDLEALYFVGDDPVCTDHLGSWALDLTDIDWLIVGGESGPGHRPMREEWARGLRDVSQLGEDLAFRLGNTTPTAFFFKQWGGATPKAGGRELDGRTWDEMPTARVGVPA